MLPTRHRWISTIGNACAAAFAMPLTTHLAESVEEFDMFRHGARTAVRLHGVPRPADDGLRGETPFGHLWKSGA